MISEKTTPTTRMKMINAFRRYCKRFKYVIKNLEGVPYLVRYRLIQTNGWCVYLHHILRSDGDRELHDHPFDFITILLWGGYFEFQPDNMSWLSTCSFQQVSTRRGIFSVIRHKAKDPHRLELINDRPAWSLFIRGPRQRDWGFYINNRAWVKHDRYTELKLKDKDDKSIQPNG